MRHSMRHSMKWQSLAGIMILGLLLAMAIPATALGQGRGRGHGRGHNGDSVWSNNKKCAKFRNCHDARDGRWDGRGPRGSRVGNIWRNRNRRDNDNIRHRRFRNVNNNRYWWRNRRR